MADLKTFWDNPVMPTSSDLGGDGVTASGSDPSITVDAPNALQPIWTNDPVPTLNSGAETENSVSGLPALPNRYQPTEQPPPPPTLQDRRPGTIDER
jgi:hypothetical protein